MYMFWVYWLCVYFVNHTWVNVAIVQMFSLLSNFVLVFSTLFFCMRCTCFVVKTQTNATIPDICLDVSDSGLKMVAVTRRYCVKTKKASGMLSSPSGSPKTLVFWRQISSPNSKGFPPNGGLKQGLVRKIQRFFSFKRQYLETVADTAKVTISD